MQLFPDVSAGNVHHRLCEIGLCKWVHWSKPYLSSLHIKQQKKWAEVEDWSKEDWGLVLFSDEFQFNPFGSDGRPWCWRRIGEKFLLGNVKKQVKHAGRSSMV